MSHGHTVAAPSAFTLSAQRQLTLPRDVMEAVGLRPGDSVYYEVGASPEGCVLLVPVEVASRWWGSGRRLDVAESDIDGR